MRSKRRIIYSALAGALGGAIGWAPGELLAWPHFEIAFMRYVMTALYFIVISATIGACLGLIDRRPGQTLKRMKSGAILGAIGGAIGSILGEWAFEVLRAGGYALVGRAAGWAIVGAFIGFSQGAVTKDPVREWRGALGGLIGGYLGGGFFEIIGWIFPTGVLSRLIATVLLGAFIGAFIVIIERMLAQAWLYGLTSRYEGREYIISKNPTTIGKDELSDIGLFGDPEVSPKHAIIAIESKKYWLQDAGSDKGTFVNGQRLINRHQLVNGDKLRFGGLEFIFREKFVKGEVPIAQSQIETSAVREEKPVLIEEEERRPSPTEDVKQVICPSCGTPNKVGAKFCRQCGRDLTQR